MIHYLASPYSSNDKAMQEYRYHKVMEAVSLFMIQDIYVYSPIVHCHEMAKRFRMRTDAHFWREYNEYFIRHFKSVFVLTEEGWSHSIGVTMEIAYAMRNGFPVHYWSNNSEKMVEVTEIIEPLRRTAPSPSGA